MIDYGLSSYDLEFARRKRDSQLSYLENNFFNTSSGQVKSLLDVSFSANLSERYYSQLSNKINTMHNLAFSLNLVPVFLTITLDGFFRGMLSGNFTKWKKKNEDFKKDYLRHIPNNEIYGYLVDKIKDEKRLTVKELYNVLNFQWFNFSKSYAFKKLKKNGKQFIYLKAAEPHKDGVPHFHVLLWIPQDSIPHFQSSFKSFFPAPRNHVEIQSGNLGDTYGFQTAIYNPVGYIMKYATKSFMDLRTGEDLNYLQAWYVKHKIRRITTSHSTVPQWVYQKCYALESDWFHLTDLTIREPMLCEWNREDDYFILIEDSGRTIEFDRGLLRLFYIDGPVIKEIGERSDRPKSQLRQIEKVPNKWLDPRISPKRFIDVVIDGKTFVWRDGDLIEPVRKPLLMKDYELLSYWQNIDFETVDLNHLDHVRSELLKRGLIDREQYGLELHHDSDQWGVYVDLLDSDQWWFDDVSTF